MGVDACHGARVVWTTTSCLFASLLSPHHLNRFLCHSHPSPGQDLPLRYRFGYYFAGQDALVPVSYVVTRPLLLDVRMPCMGDAGDTVHLVAASGARNVYGAEGYSSSTSSGVVAAFTLQVGGWNATASPPMAVVLDNTKAVVQAALTAPATSLDVSRQLLLIQVWLCTC